MGDYRAVYFLLKSKIARYDHADHDLSDVETAGWKTRRHPALLDRSDGPGALFRLDRSPRRADATRACRGHGAQLVLRQACSGSTPMGDHSETLRWLKTENLVAFT